MTVVVLRQVVAAQCRVADGAERGEAVAEEAHRMLFQRQPGRDVILHDMLAERHGRQRDGWFREKLVAQMRRQQRQCIVGLQRCDSCARAGADADHVEPPRRP